MGASRRVASDYKENKTLKTGSFPEVAELAGADSSIFRLPSDKLNVDELLSSRTFVNGTDRFRLLRMPYGDQVQRLVVLGQAEDGLHFGIIKSPDRHRAQVERYRL